ncbi:exocyst complex component EXO70B1-like [Pistacia vera]|uniref:exocyst complex component EXO70B1-like n=1 Tax=Pistacia vera TaxID=55513 RepID=UPI001263B6E9|nr:exocyst complex component EXO70B1-like [Pistacia vera]
MEKFLALETSATLPKSRDHRRNECASHARHQSEIIRTKSTMDHLKGDAAAAYQKEIPQKNIVDESASLPQVLPEVDEFIDTLSPEPSQIPESIGSFYRIFESFIKQYESRESSMRFGENQEEDDLLFECVKRVSKLLNGMGEFSSKDEMGSSLNQGSNVLHRAMSLLDEEFRALLYPKRCRLELKTPKTPKQSTFNYNSLSTQDLDRYAPPETVSNEDEEFPDFSQEAISNMNMIATSMISAGYESECCLVYSIFRKMALGDQLTRLGFDNISFDDLQRMQWESLEGEISMWISIFRHCYTVLFPGERKLSDSIFSEYPSISQRLFSDLAAVVIKRFLNFGEGVVLTKSSTEKLFKFLDMHETFRDLLPLMGDLCSCESAKDLIFEICVAQSRIGKMAVNIFSELESSIKSDQGRIPVPSGQVHPLTRYTMNYLKYACEYTDTLEEVFKQQEGVDMSNEPEPEDCSDNGTPRKSPFSKRLMTIMDLLDANLDMKSKLYRDPSLSNIFLMNNGRYILQKIKGSTEIHDIMGATWRRKRSTDLRQYHKSYQRETWSRVLQCISHEGLQSNGKVLKPVLKERFKNFNTLFEEIHKTQSTWVVSDEQLQSELRVSISAVVIPAYRSFLGRFRQYLEGSKQGEKYIKYQPEDVETYIEELFDGNPMSMGRRRT